MAPKTRENPFGIDPARDLHHQPAPRNLPLANENCLFEGYDPDNKILFYHHMGLIADDTTLWQGDFCLTLGDGRLLMARNFGRYETSTGMGDGTLIFECMEPLRQWRVTFDGVAYLTTQEENRNRFSGFDQYPVPTKFDIIWEGCSPMFQSKRADDGNLTTGYDVRYEQGGTFRGYLKYFDKEITIGGPGYRDHSVGPRNLELFTGHVWTVATWPESGRVIGTLNMEQGETVRSATPYVVIDGELKQAEYISGPYWGPGRNDFDDKTFEVVFRADGKDHVIQAETLDEGYYWTCFAPSQLTAGMDPNRMLKEKHWVTKEVAVKYTWDGAVTYGLLEISRRLGDR